MDAMLEAIHSAMPFFYILALLALILKVTMVFTHRGFNIIALMMSFFKIYTLTERSMTSKKGRRAYMAANNWVNYYLYFLTLLFVMLLLIFQKNMFVYQ